MPIPVAALPLAERAIDPPAIFVDASLLPSATAPLDLAAVTYAMQKIWCDTEMMRVQQYSRIHTHGIHIVSKQ